MDTLFLKSLYDQPCTLCERKPCKPWQLTATPPEFPPYHNNYLPLCKEHFTEASSVPHGSLIKRYRVFYLWLIQNRRMDIVKHNAEAVKESGWHKEKAGSK